MWIAISKEALGRKFFYFRKRAEMEKTRAFYRADLFVKFQTVVNLKCKDSRLSLFCVLFSEGPKQ